MTNIDNFKLFVKNNPILINYVKNGSSSWQSFYELYDLYGEDNNIWDKYLKSNNIEKEQTPKKNSFNNILDMAKNIDSNKLQDGISSVQKAIDLFSGMLVKDKDNNLPSSKNYTPRPIYRKFDD